MIKTIGEIEETIRYNVRSIREHEFYKTFKGEPTEDISSRLEDQLHFFLAGVGDFNEQTVVKVPSRWESFFKDKKDKCDEKEYQEYLRIKEKYKD